MRETSTFNFHLSLAVVYNMASPQPPPGPLGNGSDGNGPTDKQQSTSSNAAQPVVEILGGDAYAAVIVCALLLLNMTSGMKEVRACVTLHEALRMPVHNIVILSKGVLCGAVFMNGGCTC